MKPGKGHVGLLIRHTHALKFLTGAKTLEIRNRQVRFLQAGDCVVLVSTGQGPRLALGILKYTGTIRIEDAAFTSYMDRHQVSEETYQNMKSNWKVAHDYCWGWEFNVFHKFVEPLLFNRKFPGTEVWLYFTLDCLCFEKASDSGAQPEEEPGDEPGSAADPGHDSCRMWFPVQWAQTFLNAAGVPELKAIQLEKPLAPKPQHAPIGFEF
eukprot:s1002_g12.t1